MRVSCWGRCSRHSGWAPFRLFPPGETLFRSGEWSTELPGQLRSQKWSCGTQTLFRAGGVSANERTRLCHLSLCSYRSEQLPFHLHHKVAPFDQFLHGAAHSSF